MTGRLTMYTTTWCGYCVRLKHGLERAGIEFDEVNIEHDPAAEEFVLSVNGGNATVPTLVLAQRRGHDQPAAPRPARRRPGGVDERSAPLSGTMEG